MAAHADYRWLSYPTRSSSRNRWRLKRYWRGNPFQTIFFVHRKLHKHQTRRLGRVSLMTRRSAGLVAVITAILGVSVAFAVDDPIKDRKDLMKGNEGGRRHAEGRGAL
jgi:hypothetical protein